MSYSFTPTIVKRYFHPSDLFAVLVLGTIIYGVVALGKEWQGEFRPAVEISLSLWALPGYVLQSALRGWIAYFLSLIFTLIIGYIAAKNKMGELILIPTLDILQSIPVLGFLPGLVLGLIAIFPHSNIGLELSAIIMIFTGQVWNMTFSYYASLKSVPKELDESAQVIGLTRWQKLVRLELPYSAMNLAWNSLMSMSGGWFFLSICEAFTMGNQQYRLAGIGSYMSIAIAKGNVPAIISGIIAMAIMIIILDFLIWRPVLALANHYRIEEMSDDTGQAKPLIQLIMKDSRIIRLIKIVMVRRKTRRRIFGKDVLSAIPRPFNFFKKMTFTISPWIFKFFVIFLGGIFLFMAIKSGIHIFRSLTEVSLSLWLTLIKNTLFTFGRVFAALAISTLWAVPVGIWIGMSSKRVRIVQPIVEILSSFPAPMIYPIVLAVLLGLNISFTWIPIVLMLLGIQWYVLFNVLAGALRIPGELKLLVTYLESSTWDRWKTLYLPSIFPNLITGWITAAGGAWNASIVAEYITYNNHTLSVQGLGSTISIAAETKNFSLLAASLIVMVVGVIGLNRGVWRPLYRLAQSRFRLD